MSYHRELYNAMEKLLENHPELAKGEGDINELRYFLLFQEYIDFDPTDTDIGGAYAVCALPYLCSADEDSYLW